MAIAANTVGVCTVKDAAQILGIKKSTLNFWDETDFIRPRARLPIGRKFIRQYTFQDLVALRVANQLREAGVSLQALRRIVNYLQEKDGIESPLSVKMLVAIGYDVYEIKSKDELYSVLKKPGQGALKYVVDLEETVQEVKQDLRELAAA